MSRPWPPPTGRRATSPLGGLDALLGAEVREVKRLKGSAEVLGLIEAAVPALTGQVEMVGITGKALRLACADAPTRHALSLALRCGLEEKVLAMSRGAFNRIKLQ